MTIASPSRMTDTVPLAVRAPSRSIALDIETVSMVYVALPIAIFIFSWIAAPLGPIAATLLLVGTFSLVRRERSAALVAKGLAGQRSLWLLVVAIALLWTLLAGLGHFFYANADWIVRDAVLVDLVRDRWPVVYQVDGSAMLLHAPIGYYLPAAMLGKWLGLAVAEYALLGWTAAGVALTFALMFRDRPALKPALIRLAVFVGFSGMDVLGTVLHYKPVSLGEHLEWWAFLFQYSSQTTLLFWVPNHTLPGWIAMAWLVGQQGKRLPVGTAILFVAFAPLWSPLTALGLAPLFGAAIAVQAWKDGIGPLVRKLVDPRVAIPVLVTLVLVCPYLVSGTDSIESQWSWQVRFVGEDFVPRYVEFVLFEFVGFAVLLLRRDRSDVLMWVATGILLALPFYHYGVWNDLAMRASIPPLALIAIRLGAWLGSPLERKDFVPRGVAVCLLCVGAVTPFMEFARALTAPPWPIDAHASVVDIIRGGHYIAPLDRPWARHFLKQSDP